VEQERRCSVVSRADRFLLRGPTPPLHRVPSGPPRCRSRSASPRPGPSVADDQSRRRGSSACRGPRVAVPVGPAEHEGEPIAGTTTTATRTPTRRGGDGTATPPRTTDARPPISATSRPLTPPTVVPMQSGQPSPGRTKACRLGRCPHPPLGDRSGSTPSLAVPVGVREPAKESDPAWWTSPSCGVRASSLLAVALKSMQPPGRTVRYPKSGPARRSDSRGRLPCGTLAAAHFRSSWRSLATPPRRPTAGLPATPPPPQTRSRSAPPRPGASRRTPR
jgi:hypothetical protein